MPTFCRHNRFIQNCPICSKTEDTPVTRAAAPRPRTTTSRRSASRSPSSRSGLRVSHSDRAADDGYRHELVPGLRATADAERLADEIAFSAARLAELATDPPGVYAEIASATDVEEATWLAFLTAYLSPLEGDADAFAAIRSVAVPWSTGEIPDLSDVALGPRTAHDPSRGDRTLVAYRAWSGRSGSQAKAFTGDSVWAPDRRFDRVFERLSLPGFHRIARFDLLTTLGRLGVYELKASRLHFGVGNDETELAGKRVFGIGDRAVLEQRAADLASEADVPLDALDLALSNFGKPEGRATLGSRAQADEASRDRIRAALGAGATADV